MAKQSTTRGAPARIRFVVLEAEIPDGDLSQITSAIQNALKTNTTVIQQRLPAQAPALRHEANHAETEFDGEAIEVAQDDVVESAKPRQQRESRPRKPASMKVLEFDLTSEPSFESFAGQHAPKNDTERNLVALAWLKEHRPNEIATANHVYTCYRTVKWPAGIEDFPSILRVLKAQQLVKSVGRGQYEINHLGIARVEKLGPAA